MASLHNIHCANPRAVKVHCANNGAWIGAMDFNGAWKNTHIH